MREQRSFLTGRGSTRSPFAIALAQLLDETAYFTRAQWARFLGISTSAISQWLNDKTVPRADLLRMVLDVLHNSADVPPEPLAHFQDVALQPATQVSPLGARMMPTIDEYLRRTTFAALGKDLRGLAPDDLQSVLVDGSWGKPRMAERPALLDTHCVSPRRDGAAALDDNMVVDYGLLPGLVKQQSSPPSLPMGLEALSSMWSVLLVGEVGCGKSAILFAVSQTIQERQPAPILLSGHAFWRADAGPAPLATYAPVEGRSRAILIDGFDEIPEERRTSAAQEILDLKERSPACQIMVSSRPVSELSLFAGFEKVAVAPLTSVQMILWLDRSKHRDESTPSTGPAEMERFLCHLTESKALGRTCRNPLFLHSAWTLFLRNAVTPFAEAEMLGSFARCLLDERDRRRQVVRAREPWASPHRLASLLGELCFQLMTSNTREFETDDAERWLATQFREIPCKRLLSLLAVQSGILSETSSSRWQVVHDDLLIYFAALHVVESLDNAWAYLSEWKEREEVREVLRLACGISSDASGLLRGVLAESGAHEAERCALLADIMAQPLIAEREVMEASCDAMVGWLDRALKGWYVSNDEAVHRSEAAVQPLWQLRARATRGKTLDPWVGKALTSTHRARSGPVRHLLQDRLRHAECPVLPAFADSLNFEGNLRFESIPSQRRLQAAVVAPVLA